MLTICLNLGGCSKEEPGLLTREQMWVWVGQHVQVGMPLEAASETLQKAGFECQRFKKTAAKIIDINKTATEGTYDFLRGDREDGSPPIKRHWEITLVHEGAKVSAIGLRYRDVYPNGKGNAEPPRS